MLVNPAIIEDILIADPGIREYQVVIERENPDDALSPDRLRLRLAHAADDETAAAGIAAKVKTATGISPVVALEAAQDIYAAGDTLKSRRIVDTRR